MADSARHVRTTIRYDGPALAGHEMDVQELAPALLALAELIQIANRKFNGTDADIKVLVSADVEQRCFMIDISLVQSFLDQAKIFLGTDHVKTAREIAEWIGLIGGGATATGVGLFQLLKFLRSNKGAEAPLQVKTDADGNIVVSAGGNSIVVPRPVYDLAQEPRAVDQAKRVLRPLAREGYETMAFLEGDAESFAVDGDDAAEIGTLPDQPLSDVPSESVSNIQGQVRIKSAQYEGSAQWAFLWNGRAINAEMTGQAAEWVADFQANKIAAPPNSILDVSMQETAQLNAQGLIVGKPSYRVIEVRKVTAPPSQIRLFGDDEA